MTAGGDAPRALFVVNPASGSGRTARRWQPLVEQLGIRGVTGDAHVTTCSGDARDAVADYVDRGGRRIVVLGGDGTVGEAVDGCIADGAPRATGLELAIIHQGTGGDFARGLGIPRDAEAALDVAANGVLRRVDVGVASFQTTDGTSTRAFAEVANVGLAADVVRRAEGRLKALGDSVGFGLATTASLARMKPTRLRMVVDGETHEIAVTDLVIANGRFMGGGMAIAPDADPGDGLLDVIVIAAAPRWRLLITFPKVYAGRHVTDPLVRCMTARSIEVEPSSGGPYGVVLDGELVGTTPARFTIAPGALHVRVAG